MDDGSESLSPWRWWLGRRLLWYDAGLAGAGLLAFIFYVTIIFRFEDRIPDADVNALTTVIQAIAYLVAMIFANVCYLIGPVSECLLKPRTVGAYRRGLYWTGFCFSVSLPLLVPVVLLCEVLGRH